MERKDVVKGTLKLKGFEKKDKKKKKKDKKEKDEDAVEPAASSSSTADAILPQVSADAKTGKTAAQRAFDIAREKRKESRMEAAVQLTHREKMERFNNHCSRLAEHFDMPKVGPG